MKNTMFKVHSVYSKEDIVQMEKMATRKLRHRSMFAAGIILLLYVGLLLWTSVQETGQIVLAFLIPASVLEMIVVVTVICTFVMMLSMPYHKANRTIKEAPGGVIKGNYYFYEKTFQYGWGNHFATIAYMDVQEFWNLPTAFYIKAEDLSYWIKKTDFEVGTPEEFAQYIKGKIHCKKVVEK